MTVIAYVARLVTIAMSLGIIYAIAKMAEELRGRRASWCAAAVCAVNAPFTYYAKTSNLDVPYLFWTCLALLALMRAIARREPDRLRTMALCAGLAVGTKDQAYAVFIGCVPAACGLWLALDSWARVHIRRIFRAAWVAALAGGALVVAVDGVIFNPTGFRARVAFLVGPASQDFVNYTIDWAGRAVVIRDSLANFGWFYPWVFVGFVVFGAALLRALWPEKEKFVASLVPALAALSFTVGFNCVARRTEHRFLLPQALLVAVYAGIAVEQLVFEIRAPVTRGVSRAATGAAFALAIFGCANVDANLLLDPRYESEAWLDANVATGDAIEVHGLNVYLPRLPFRARVTRIGPDPAARRSPLPGVVELQDAYGDIDARRPRFIVVSEGWVWRYRQVPDRSGAPVEWGRSPAPALVENAADQDAVTFFRGLFEETRGYRVAHTSSFNSRVWSALDYHKSTSRGVWVFQRQE
jgi:4-amino-4-deoxy-L-arabinose transferase-like glycosyltransferase